MRAAGTSPLAFLPQYVLLKRKSSLPVLCMLDLVATLCRKTESEACGDIWDALYPSRSIWRVLRRLRKSILANR
jgi:hypothetical protein